MPVKKRTKIIATLGPASEKEDILEKILAGGVDCVRLNFSHGDHEEHGRRIKSVRALDKKLGKHTAIIADIQGPKMRVGKMPKEGLMLAEGEKIILDCSKKEYTGDVIPLPSKTFLEGTPEGSQVFLDDGVLSLRITKKKGTQFEALVLKGGLLFSSKGINVPAIKIEGSVLNDKDRADMKYATQQEVDYIALSFLRTADDVKEAREFINDKKVKLIAKIERPEALENIDEIIKESDAIMVARGDLGIETPMWELPVRQKEIVQKVREQMKPVIVATQMLDSMIRDPLPTRAEVSDIANAVYDSADAVMLSGETASGKNPLEAVEIMRKVLESTESNQDYMGDKRDTQGSAMLSLARSASRISSRVGAKAIFVETFSGESARVISHFRPNNVIVALTNDKRTAGQLALVWGVVPFIIKAKSIKKVEDILSPITGELKSKGFLKSGDAVLCVYDSNFKFSEKANVNSITITSV
jgi:pyruvate kinase